jgi:hypothetical protein
MSQLIKTKARQFYFFNYCKFHQCIYDSNPQGASYLWIINLDISQQKVSNLNSNARPWVNVKIPALKIGYNLLAGFRGQS